MWLATKCTDVLAPRSVVVYQALSASTAVLVAADTNVGDEETDECVHVPRIHRQCIANGELLDGGE